MGNNYCPNCGSILLQGETRCKFCNFCTNNFNNINNNDDNNIRSTPFATKYVFRYIELMIIIFELMWHGLFQVFLGKRGIEAGLIGDIYDRLGDYKNVYVYLYVGTIIYLVFSYILLRIVNYYSFKYSFKRAHYDNRYFESTIKIIKRTVLVAIACMVFHNVIYLYDNFNALNSSCLQVWFSNSEIVPIAIAYLTCDGQIANLNVHIVFSAIIRVVGIILMYVSLRNTQRKTLENYNEN